MRIVEAHEAAALERAAAKVKASRPGPLRHATPLLAELVNMVEAGRLDATTARKTATHLLEKTVHLSAAPVDVIKVAKALGVKLIDRAPTSGVGDVHDSLVTASITASNGGRKFTVAVPTITAPVLVRHRLAYAIGIIIANPDAFANASTVDMLRYQGHDTPQERFADIFAAELLIPDHLLVFDITFVGREVSEFELTKKYDVPYATMCSRVEADRAELRRKNHEFRLDLERKN